MQQAKVTQHRVQVNFPADLYHKVRRKAFDQKISISKLIRTIVAENITTSHKKTATKEQSWKRFMDRYMGIIKGYQDDSLSHNQWAHNTATFHEK